MLCRIPTRGSFNRRSSTKRATLAWAQNADMNSSLIEQDSKML